MIDQPSTVEAAAASVRAVTGVVATHDPRPPIARAVAATAAALRRTDVDAPHVVVEVEPALTVSTAITTDVRGSTPQIAREVADVLLAQHPLAEEVLVHVRRIGTRNPA